MKPNTPLTLLALAAGTLLAQHVSAGDLPNGRYTIHPVNSGKCVDVAWASTADGANIAQVSCNGNNAQVFDVVDSGNGWYKLTNVNSGKVMDVAGNATHDGANIHQWSDNGSGAQRFSAKRVNGNEFVLTNKTSGKCVDVAGGSTADGANIQQWSCNGSSAQRYRFVPVGMAGVTLPVGRYTLKSAHSGMCLDVAGGSTADNANIQQWNCNGSGAQAFDLIADGGNYHLLNANSGKSLDVANQSTANGADVLQWPWWGGNNQRFTLIDKGNSQYEVHFRHSDKCLDVDGWSTAAGGDVRQWACGGSQANQKWSFTPTAGGDGNSGGSCNPTPVWSDEFNYTGQPDASKWSFEVQRPGWVNHEWQNYTGNRPENARVENGKLVIEARRDWFQGYEISSARLKTAYKGDWLNGRIEVRAKLPRGRGTWPAIWMMPTDSAYGGWPNSGEIDIMENVGYDPNAIHGSIHTNGRNFMLKNNFQVTTYDGSVMDSFHTYAIDWNQDRIEFIKDGQRFGSYTNPRQGWSTWPFDKRFYLILNLAIGGDWGGAQGVDMNIFPARMEVDWVRVYKSNPCN